MLIERFFQKGRLRGHVALYTEEKESNEENLELTTSYSVRNNFVRKTTSMQFDKIKYRDSTSPWSASRLVELSTDNSHNLRIDVPIRNTMTRSTGNGCSNPDSPIFLGQSIFVMVAE